jgi:hypothetical protein
VAGIFQKISRCDARDSAPITTTSTLQLLFNFSNRGRAADFRQYDFVSINQRPASKNQG